MALLVACITNHQQMCLPQPNRLTEVLTAVHRLHVHTAHRHARSVWLSNYPPHHASYPGVLLTIVLPFVVDVGGIIALWCVHTQTWQHPYNFTVGWALWGRG